MAFVRRAPRRVVQLPVSYRISGSADPFRSAETRDISTTGAYIEAAEADPGQSVQLSLDLGNGALRLLGQVVRRDGSGVGIQFYGVGDQARLTLGTIVAVC